MIYSFYIFDRHCNCIFYTSWNQAEQKDLNQIQEDSKLVYGVVFSIRNIITKLSNDKKSDPFFCYHTNTYKLNYYETPSALRLVLFTDANMENQKQSLLDIYANVYVPYVSKNPMIPHDSAINNDLFRSNLQKLIRAIPGFDQI